VARSYRFARTPRWVAGHVLVLAAAVTMGFLGHWQLDVSNAKHFALQNFGYALQWWAFAGFALVLWIKIIRDVAGTSKAARAAESRVETEAGAQAEPPVAYRRYVPPTVAAPAGDADLDAYNAYLRHLAAKDER
jgi:DNA-binding transcriptional regulator of glucitol operon